MYNNTQPPTSYIFISDPGHAWLRVPRHLVTPEMEISKYSYIDANFIYLEEDSDAYKYLKTLEIKPEITEHHVERTQIRNMNRYTPGTQPKPGPLFIQEPKPASQAPSQAKLF